MSFDRLGGAPEHLLKESHYPIVSIPIPVEWQIIDLFSYLFDLSVDKKIAQMKELNTNIAQNLATLDAIVDKKSELQGVTNKQTITITINHTTTTTTAHTYIHNYSHVFTLQNHLRLMELEGYLARIRKDLSSDIRTRRWLHDLLFCSQEQEVMLGVVEVYTGLIKKAREMDPGFAYVPVTYMATLLTTYRSLSSFHLHETGFELFDFESYPQNAAVLTAFYRLLIGLLVDDRLVSPDAKEGVQDIIHSVIQTGKGLSVIEADPRLRDCVIDHLLRLAQRDPEAAVELGRSFRAIFGGSEFCRPPPGDRGWHSGSPTLQTVVLTQMRSRNITKLNSSESVNDSDGGSVGDESSGNPLFDAFYDRMFDLVNNAFSDFEIGLNAIGEKGLSSVPTTGAIEKFKVLMRATERLSCCQRALEVMEKAAPELFHARSLNTVRLCEVIAYAFWRLFADTPTARTVARVHTFLDKHGVKVIPPFTPVLPVVSFIGICVNMWRYMGCATYDAFAKTPNFDPDAFAAVAKQVDITVLKNDFHATEESVADYPLFVEFCKYSEEQKKKKMEATAAAADANNTSNDDPVKAALENTELDDDDLCEICFANKIDTEFVPCGHRSCRICIERQMITEPVCFFCKAHIDELKKV